MTEQLETNGFVTYSNFLSTEEHKEVYDLFETQNSIFSVDGTGYLSLYNSPILVSLLCEKLLLMQDIISDKLLPTYSYGRKYQNNQSLPKHVDRPSCEISATINIYGESWPIYIEDKSKNVHSVILEPKSALIYEGIILTHWREKLPSNEYWQIFLHYVKKYGPNNHLFFDTHGLRVKLEKQKFFAQKT
jgi:hypothetical protein